MNGRDAQKRAAAARAVVLIESGMRIGLGTGSTAKHVVQLLAERLRTGEIHDIVGVPTSVQTRDQAASLNVPLATLDQITRLDLTIDGADEVDPRLDLIKGLGGALLWEKIVARASARLVIVADDSKEVERLGRRAPLPVEVVPFGWRTHERAFAELGARPVLRSAQPVGAPFVTDSGHYIVDLHFDDGIADAAAVEAVLGARAGIVETGLFLGMASAVVIATADGVRMRERDAA
ncbi:MAG: ribose-5-phosphate isomerase RpiA [Gemmatimonadota bacterium]